MTEIDWKEKYRLLVERQGADELEQAEIERLLCRTISRLTIATSGLDPNLDPNLTKIRGAIRDGVRPELKKTLDVLSDALMRTDESKLNAADGGVEPDLLQRLLGRINLAGKPAAQLDKIIRQLQADPANISDAQLDELLALIASKSGSTADSQARSGLLGRIFKQEDDSHKAVASSTVSEPNQVLLRLLEKLNWPAHLAGEMADLMARLDKGAADEAWISVLDDLGRLITSALGEIQTEMRATEDFLSELTLRLQELDQHMAGTASDRADASQNGKALNAAVQGEMGEIQHSLSIATDLKSLRSDIAHRLDAIQGHVDAHLEAEEIRRKNTLAKEQALRQRLHLLENETMNLHSKMLDAKSKALEDPVTGLPNRIAYEERLATEVARWKRTQNPLVLLVWDVDDFKQINDRFGHKAGDKALRVIGRILSARPRELDFVGRYGGEEFVMLLVNSSLENAKRLAEEIREAVANSGFHSSAKDKIPITISCGISEFRAGDTADDVFVRADEAMYRAKREGKNRVIAG